MTICPIFKKWPVLKGKEGKNIKKRKTVKIYFQGPIRVSEVSIWEFWGLVCIEKWSQKFDSGTQSAIFGTPKTAKMASF